MDIIFDQLTNQDYPFSVEQRVSRALSVALTLIGGKSFSIRLEKGTSLPQLPLTVDTSFVVFPRDASPHGDTVLLQLVRWKDAGKDELCVSFTPVEKWEMCADGYTCTGVFTAGAKTAPLQPTKRCHLALHQGPLSAFTHAAELKNAALVDRAAVTRATKEMQEYMAKRALGPLGAKTTPTAHQQSRNCEPDAEGVLLVRPPTSSQVEK